VISFDARDLMSQYWKPISILPFKSSGLFVKSMKKKQTGAGGMDPEKPE
jgi:hypothetical protein